MNDDNFNLAEKYVSHGYVQQGREARRVLEKNIRQLLEQGKIPIHGWNDLSIKHLLHEISLMDSNNFPDNCGVGEREARIASQLVAQRHFHLGHGIGRSGDIAEIQPKAAGSSLLAKLANSFALDVIKIQGVKNANSCLLVPVATGMALVLTMLMLKESRPTAKYVIWPRIDQKSCFKSMLTAGMEPLIIENILAGDQLETDISAIKTTIEDMGKENILCVLTTTSCFAPRVPDKLEDVALLCKENDIPHVVNNAYGVQSSKCMHLIEQASRRGRVDAFVQSTDKNFMVPVGGAIIAGFDKSFIQAVGKMYPGRASASPIIDFFITMLSLGDEGYKELLNGRKILYKYMKSGLREVAEQYNERCMDIKQNQISLAVTLQSVDAYSKGDKKTVTEFGSYLFKRAVSGTRVITPNDTKTIGKYTFKGWGAHTDVYPCSYFTAAAAIGTTKQDIDKFLKRLDKTFKLFIKDPDPAPIPRALKRAILSQNDLRPTRSLTEKIRDSDVILRTRPSSFSSYEASVSTWPKAGRTRINHSESDHSPEYPECSNGNVLSDQNGRHAERGCSDSSVILSKDFVKQLVLPGEIPPDKMSFLIDI